MRGPEQAHATTPDNDPSASPSSDVIVQIKAKLLGVSKPPVWRRLQLRADTRLDHLQTTSAMTGSTRSPSKTYSTPTPTPTTQSPSPRKAPAHPRTSLAAAAWDTPTSKKSLPTPATNDTKR
jgi:hypothetical protein